MWLPYPVIRVGWGLCRHISECLLNTAENVYEYFLCKMIFKLYAKHFLLPGKFDFSWKSKCHKLRNNMDNSAAMTHFIISNFL